MKRIALLVLLTLFGFYTYSQVTPASSTGMSHMLSSVSSLLSLSAVSQTIPADSSSLDYIATEVIQQNVAMMTLCSSKRLCKRFTVTLSKDKRKASDIRRGV